MSALQLARGRGNPGRDGSTDRMHVTFVVSAAVPVVGALLALLFVRGEGGAAGRLLVAG